MGKSYDFIVVGGGPAGAVVASRIAHSSPSTKVLLLEGGGDNADPSLLSPENRWMLPGNPEVNWGYMSTPQTQLNGREINCARGRGLGGSSAINFSCWLIGDKEDFNEWADIVGDDAWKWEGEGGVKQRFRKIENLHLNDQDPSSYFDREAQKLHSSTGKVDVSYEQEWDASSKRTFKAAEEYGAKISSDINSGDPTGWAIAPSTFHQGRRVTARTAYLSSPPENLTIKVNSFVSQVLFNDSKVTTGVKTLSGEIYHASKEVILSAGSLDTPKIILLSGIGPESELSALSIPVIQNVPGVGKNLKDHCYSTTTLLLKADAEFPDDVDNSLTPKAELDPLLSVGVEVPMAWFSSSSVKTSAEFAALDAKTRDHLDKVPSYELIGVGLPIGSNLPPSAFEKGAQLMTFFMAVMNAQSNGSVTLASSDPAAPAKIDVQYLAHPYDQRVAIEALRDATKLSEVPSLAAITAERIAGPPSDADDATILEHWKNTVNPVWHFASTCKMGRDDDENAVVDTKFRVKGVKSLRVVDLSVAAVLPNNHTQSTAYLIGETAAEKIIAEYGF